jgi:hypothetical protein
VMGKRSLLVVTTVWNAPGAFDGGSSPKPTGGAPNSRPTGNLGVGQHFVA